MIRFGAKGGFRGGDGDRPCMMYSGLPTQLSMGLETHPERRGLTTAFPEAARSDFLG